MKRARDDADDREEMDGEEPPKKKAKLDAVAQSLESHEDLNVLIQNKYVKDFGAVIKDNLPKELPVGIKDVIFNYTVPNKIESKPYWTPAFIESTFAKEQVKKDTFKYLTHSKYGGLPYLSSVEEWPKCKKCKKGLCFYFQLNFDTMPDKYKQKYLFNNNIYKGCILQLFYCTDDMCDGYEAFAEGHVTRIVQMQKTAREGSNDSDMKQENNGDNDSKKKHEDGFRGVEYLEKKREEYKQDWSEFGYSIDDKNEFLISDWLKCGDDKWEGPHWEDMSDIINMPNFLSSISDETLGPGVSAFIDDHYPNGDDKLGGWPCFVQGPEYPNCPKCVKFFKTGKQDDDKDNDQYKEKQDKQDKDGQESDQVSEEMERQSMMTDFIFQFDGMKIDQLLGDCGIGHITVCRKHPFVAAFAWACT